MKPDVRKPEVSEVKKLLERLESEHEGDEHVYEIKELGSSQLLWGNVAEDKMAFDVKFECRAAPDRMKLHTRYTLQSKWGTEYGFKFVSIGQVVGDVLECTLCLDGSGSVNNALEPGNIAHVEGVQLTIHPDTYLAEPSSSGDSIAEGVQNALGIRTRIVSNRPALKGWSWEPVDPVKFWAPENSALYGVVRRFAEGALSSGPRGLETLSDAEVTMLSDFLLSEHVTDEQKEAAERLAYMLEDLDVRDSRISINETRLAAAYACAKKDGLLNGR